MKQDDSNTDSLEEAWEGEAEAVEEAFKDWILSNAEEEGDDTDDDDDTELEEKEWQEYEGPRGGEGWINTVTGDRRYQEEKPGSTNQTGEGGETYEEAIEILQDGLQTNRRGKTTIKSSAIHQAALSANPGDVANALFDIVESEDDMGAYASGPQPDEEEKEEYAKWNEKAVRDLVRNAFVKILEESTISVELDNGEEIELRQNGTRFEYIENTRSDSVKNILYASGYTDEDVEKFRDIVIAQQRGPTEDKPFRMNTFNHIAIHEMGVSGHDDSEEDKPVQWQHRVNWYDPFELGEDFEKLNTLDILSSIKYLFGEDVAAEVSNRLLIDGPTYYDRAFVVDTFYDVWEDRYVEDRYGFDKDGTKMRAFQQILGIYDQHSVSTRALNMIEEVRKPMIQALRKMYGDTITVYRGEPLTEFIGTTPEDIEYDSHRPAESWSLRPKVAKDFGRAILKKEVPVEEVIFANIVGAGHRSEKEMLCAMDKTQEWKYGESLFEYDLFGDDRDDRVGPRELYAAEIQVMKQELQINQNTKTQKEWQEYEGPRGGEGWEHTDTGERRYQEQKPGDIEGTDDTPTVEPAQPIPHEQLEAGYEFLFYDENAGKLYEGVVTEIDSNTPKVFIGPDRDDKSEWVHVGPLPTNADVYLPDNPEGALADARAETGDDDVEETEDQSVAQADPHESFENPPRGYESFSLDELGELKGSWTYDRQLVWPDGRQESINRYEPDNDYLRTWGNGPYSAEELQREGVFVLRERPLDVDETTPDERLAMATMLGLSGPPKDRKGVTIHWQKFGEIIDAASQDTLSKALEYSSINSISPDGIDADTSSLPRDFMGSKPSDPGVNTDDFEFGYWRGARPSNLGPVISRMEKDVLMDTITHIASRLDASDSPNKDKYKRRLYNAAYTFAPQDGVREEINQMAGEDGIELYEDVRNLIEAKSMQEFKEAFIESWRHRGSSEPSMLVQQALADLGPNAEGRTQAWARGHSIKRPHIPDSMKRHVRELYEDTQSKLPDKPRKLYRGVGEEVSTHSNLESWSENVTIARKFGDYVMEAEVDPEDVWCTWETLGDDWPEEDVKGKKEWMVLGGALT